MEAQKLDILDPETIPEDEVFVVEDDTQAALSLRIIEAREREIDRIRLTAENEKARVDNWADSEIERHKKAINYFTGPLETFLRDINEKSQGKTKSLKYPYGTIQLRKSPDKIEVIEGFDPAEHVGDPYVKAKTTYSVDKKLIKDDMKKSGSIPEWATLVQGNLQFSYKVGG